MPPEPEDTGTWAKLRRRKVVQWGIAYAAGAWGFLQGLEYVSEAFGWPSQLRQIAIIALLIGLPVVLVIAWYHGDRGEQRVGGVELAIITFLFALGGAIFWRYEHSVATTGSATTPAAAPAAAPPAAEARPSIAVLPFENRSARQDDLFFVDGIHDDILTQLAKMSAMKVISRTSVERFRNTNLPMKEVAAQLGVTTILEGGVQRAGNRVRITVQLIDAGTDGHLWAESYDRELTAANIFAIQSEVATAIAAALHAALSPAEKLGVNAVPTRDLQAWEAYQLGKQRMANRTNAGLEAARKFFQQAIDLDPTFAPAHAGLAIALTMLSLRANAPLEAGLDRAAQVADVALKLDPNLAEAWAASGLIANSRGQTDRAEQLYRRAIALNPNYATAYQWLAAVLTDQGHRVEALRVIERALELDPLSAIVNENVGSTLDTLGRFDEAAARYRKVIEIDPTMAYPYMELALVEAYARNRFAVAVPLLEKAVETDPETVWIPMYLVQLYFDLGDDDAAIRLAEEIRTRWPENEAALTMSALVALLRDDEASARRDLARTSAAETRNSYALSLLDVVDLRHGNYDAARRRYARGYPELLAAGNPTVEGSTQYAALNLAYILQKSGDKDRAGLLLDGIEALNRNTPRLGAAGYGITDVAIHALRGQKREALSALRAAQKQGWRGGDWPQRYYRDLDPTLASIRDEPEFKAVFADIARDMERQRAELRAARAR